MEYSRSTSIKYSASRIGSVDRGVYSVTHVQTRLSAADSQAAPFELGATAELYGIYQ